jgi:predicted transcriptional regulator
MPINSWTINLILGFILSVMAGVGYYTWKHNVEDAALSKAKIEALENEIATQQEIIKDLESINKEGNALIADLKDKEIDLNQKLSELETYLKNHVDDHESSEVLKRTFKDLAP